MKRHVNMSPTYDDIRKLIERRFRRQVLFGLHLSAFLFLSVVLGWWVLTREPVPGDMQHMWLIAAWFAVIVAHGFIVRMANARDREIEAMWSGVYGVVSSEKQKFGLDEDRYVYLFEDGEWIGDIEATEKPKQRG